MTESLVARKFFNVTPPRAYTGASAPGEVVVLVTGAAIALDLRSFSNATYDASDVNKAQNVGNQKGAVNEYLIIFAETADLGIVFGKTLASVTAGNAPVLATTGTVNGSGIYSNAAGTCIRLPAGAFYDVIPSTEDLFMGIVASSAGVIRIWQSSPSNP